MPTTPDEARAIVHAAGDYISPVQLYRLLARLDATVGKSTENCSVRDSMTMLKDEAAQLVLAEARGDLAIRVPDPVAHPGLRAFLFAFLVLWVIAHMLYIAVLIAAFLVLPFFEPWYVAAPLMAVPPMLAVNRGPCPLTTVENWLRGAVGLPRIGGFIKHYFVRTGIACLRYMR